MLKSITPCLLLIILSACSSNNAGVVYHDSFDFSRVKNYSLYERNSPFTETQSLLHNRRNAIEIAIEGTMAKKKFSYANVENADLIVTYHIFNGRGNDFSKYNKAVHFCSHCLRATTWQTDRQYSSVSEGSLVLDLFDPIRKRSVWRSIYSLDLEDKDNSAETNDKIKQAVAAMLEQYPKTKLVN